MGPMQQGKRQVRFTLVAVDYFTKWVEVEPLATVITTKIEHFVWKNITCQFGILHAIVTNDDK